ncbi:hypothetical protein Ccrd_011660 [Cynara cardunculus var. scolymus]|uniref:F-box domain-containing protein n=1 Tax=Cynara cardunculus var. scolymus TaxID=59895 RepID=A0A103YIY3_CYNCS|nr:hypothetical protein Ccrd_011660 [Cynara cardunculus var. scolymus]
MNFYQKNESKNDGKPSQVAPEWVPSLLPENRGEIGLKSGQIGSGCEPELGPAPATGYRICMLDMSLLSFKYNNVKGMKCFICLWVISLDTGIDVGKPQQCMMRKKRQLAQNKDALQDLGSDDLLSRFSDDILVSIISRLPLKDAVVTSQLSRRWRYLWCQTVRLDFEDKERSNKLMDFAERNKYINWVNYIIRQHKSSNIDEFKICFDLDKNGRGAIGKWIEFAISKNVKTLELDLRHKNGIISYGWRNYVFPNKIFDRKCGSSLKRQSSNFPARPYASVMEIKFLKTLILKCVDVNDEGLKKILNNCPVLEHLSIHGSCHMVKAKIHGKGLALKTLEIRSCVGLESIEICDSNLVSFTLKGSPITIRVDNLQKLEKISIGEGYSWKKINRLFSEISCCVPYLQVLELDLYRPPVPPFPELLKLKQLILKVGAWDNDSVHVLTSLVEACPNLRRFKIQLIWSIWVRPNGEVRQVAKQPHEHLEVVEIGGYYGRTSDFELAMYFIENGVALKKLVIDPSDLSMKRSRLVANEIMENGARYHAYQQLKPRTPVGVELGRDLEDMGEFRERNHQQHATGRDLEGGSNWVVGTRSEKIEIPLLIKEKINRVNNHGQLSKVKPQGQRTEGMTNKKHQLQQQITQIVGIERSEKSNQKERVIVDFSCGEYSKNNKANRPFIPSKYKEEILRERKKLYSPLEKRLKHFH